VMDVFTRRIIGFGVERADPCACRFVVGALSRLLGLAAPVVVR
jgi:hypothetical protein